MGCVAAPDLGFGGVEALLGGWPPKLESLGYEEVL